MMMEAHIPPADAERLINQFNRVSFPIVRDDRLLDILKDVVTNTPSEQVEAIMLYERRMALCIISQQI